ncbi:dockerin type I repeat-containing protein [Ruminococcus sp.]|uniref:dockerin type I repeat-containing protein n=1 Tax=Ruminococcus sp. TaxID=41978 RepID=UPI003419244A
MTVADIVLLKRYLLHLDDFSKIQTLHADLNEDKKVNGIDLALLRQAIANQN